MQFLEVQKNKSNLMQMLLSANSIVSIRPKKGQVNKIFFKSRKKKENRKESGTEIGRRGSKSFKKN